MVDGLFKRKFMVEVNFENFNINDLSSHVNLKAKKVAQIRTNGDLFLDLIFNFADYYNTKKSPIMIDAFRRLEKGQLRKKIDIVKKEYNQKVFTLLSFIYDLVKGIQT